MIRGVPNRNIMEKVVFITGATSGIGLSCANRFAASGFRLIIAGRRADRLNEIAGQLHLRYDVQVYPLVLDVTKRRDVTDAVAALPADFRNIDILINNAGLALGLETLNEGDPEQWDRMIDTNLKGLLNVSHAVMSVMIKQGRGHIINLGSIAGREAYLKGNVYCATKAAVDSITKAMRIDLLPYGIKVTQVAPGAVETDFSLIRFDGDESRAKSVYQGFEPLHPDDVADMIHYAASLPPHVNINDVLLMPTAQAAATVIHRK